MKQLRFATLALLCFLPLSSVMAQKMKVESFIKLSQAEDPDARDATFRVIDTQAQKRNQYCAIIKIATTIKDQKFHFELGSDFVPEDTKYMGNGEIWLYVPAGTRKLRIHHERYGELANAHNGYYEFSMKCEAATVYRLTLYNDYNPDGVIITDPNKFAKVELQVSPKTARVALGNTLKQTNANGIVSEQMQLGIYPFRISAENYHDYDGQFELKNEGSTQQINIRLRQAFGWAELPTNFDPSDCQFYVSDKQCAINGLRIEIPSGIQKLRIEKRNHYSTTVDVNIKDSMVTSITPDIKPIMGKLVVSSPDQPGSVIKVDGKAVGVTPFSQDIIIGKHFVEISRPNYVPQTKEVTIAKGELETINVNLTSKGNFRMTSNPAGASLYINSKYIGITPCSMENIASGDYEIKLVKEDYHTVKKTVHLNAAVPDNSFKMKYQYQRKYQFYLNPVFDYGANSKAFGVNLGAYLYNINIEGFFDYGLDKKDLAWVRYNMIQGVSTYKFMAFGGRVGYGIVVGTRFRITPQVGLRILRVSGEGNGDTSSYDVAGSSKGLSFGCRLDVVLVKYLSLNITPEYRLGLGNSDNYSVFAENSPTIDGWSKGFGCRMGLSVYF